MSEALDLSAFKVKPSEVQYEDMLYAFDALVTDFRPRFSAIAALYARLKDHTDAIEENAAEVAASWKAFLQKVRDDCGSYEEGEVRKTLVDVDSLVAHVLGGSR